MEKKEFEPIKLEIELAELMLRPEFYKLLDGFADDLKKLRKETSYKKYDADVSFFTTCGRGIWDYREEKVLEVANRFLGNHKISSIDNIMFEYKYHSFIWHLGRHQVNKLFSSNEFFDNFVRFCEYLKNIEKDDPKNIIKAHSIFDHIASFEDCSINDFVLNPKYPAQERHRGNMYCYTKEPNLPRKPYTRFDYTDGNIRVDENKPDCLSYVSDHSNFVIKNIYAKPMGKLDFENNKGDYEKEVEFPECIYFNNLTFDAFALPRDNTVDATLYCLFPALKRQIEINKQIACINRNLSKLDKEKGDLKSIIELYKENELSDNQKQALAEKIQSVALSHAEILKEVSDSANIDCSKLLLADKK